MARALKQAGSTPKEGGQYVNVLFLFFFLVKLIGLSKLERVVIGEESFTKKKGGDISNRHFYLKNCERLKVFKIGSYSFRDYSVCEIENVPSLEVIEMGELKEESKNFYYASLELKSDCERMK